MKLKYALHRLREKGVMRCLGIMRERLLFTRWHLLWMERELDMPLNLRPLYPGLQWRRADSAGVQSLKQYFPAFAHLAPELLHEQTPGYLLFREETVVGYIWFSLRDYYDRQFYHYHFTVPEKSAFVINVELLPSLRRRGTASVITRIFADLRGRGVERISAVIADTNQPSLALALATGFNERGTMLQVSRYFGAFTRAQALSYEPPLLSHLRRYKGESAA
ncbi:GNAT family N-acetyltransferase [Pokkaliibacter sp. CJK22405]|uniref:GNAT family N-acetyltransferase n=1 Tax=Pokkaliibacter sp. CJK22405 TaxID=3384615 RepID=UPI003984DE1E